jgi:hypothetical protein
MRIRSHIRAIYTRSRGTYGMTRIHAELAEQGIHVGRKRVARLMRDPGLRSVSRRRWISTTQRQPDARAPPDLLKRHFNADRPDQLWGSRCDLRADHGRVSVPCGGAGRFQPTRGGLGDGINGRPVCSAAQPRDLPMQHLYSGDVATTDRIRPVHVDRLRPALP